MTHRCEKRDAKNQAKFIKKCQTFAFYQWDFSFSSSHNTLLGKNVMLQWNVARLPSAFLFSWLSVLLINVIPTLIKWIGSKSSIKSTFYHSQFHSWINGIILVLKFYTFLKNPLWSAQFNFFYGTEICLWLHFFVCYLFLFDRVHEGNVFVDSHMKKSFHSKPMNKLNGSKCPHCSTHSIYLQ